MQNKAHLELEDFEAENLAKLQKMFSRKWEFVFMQAEAQYKFVIFFPFFVLHCALCVFSFRTALARTSLQCTASQFPPTHPLTLCECVNDVKNGENEKEEEDEGSGSYQFSKKKEF